MKKVGYLLIFLANLVIIFYFWLSQSGGLLLSGPSGAFIALGRIAGLLAVYLILWQLVLIGRVKLLEQAFGLDRLAIVHHLNGFLAWTFIFLHPVLLTVGYGLAGKLNFFSQVVDFFFNWPGLAAAFAAVAIFLIVIVLSWGAIQKKLKYEAWYYVHLLVYLAIIFSFSHQLKLGADLHNNLFALYWYILYFEALALIIIYRFLKPLYLFWRHRFFVDRIEIISDRAFSIYLKGKNLQRFSVRPGQFAIFRFLNLRLVWEAHPFSFSQIANGQELRITVKSLGDYTAVLPAQLKEGTHVLIDGPHGIFTNQRTSNRKLALIAGGIGITPIRPLAEQARAEGKDVVVLCSAASPEDIIFQEELEKLSGPNFKLVFIVSNGSKWSGERGRINQEKIERLLPDYAERDFFVCGPPPMIKSLRVILKELKIKTSRIYFEKFSLY